MICEDVRITPASETHVAEFIRRGLRPEDERVAAEFGVDPVETVWRIYRLSRFPNAAIVGNKVIAIWGVATSEAGIGCPWLHIAADHGVGPVQLTKICRREILKMKEVFPVLVDFSRVGDLRTSRFLKLLGFHSVGAEPLGDAKIPHVRKELR